MRQTIGKYNPSIYFIIGRAYDLNSRTRNNSSAHLENKEKFMVPTFGFPGSDNLLSAEAGSNIPRIPTGRIALIDPLDIKIYLDKIKTYHIAQQVNMLTSRDYSLDERSTAFRWWK